MLLYDFSTLKVDEIESSEELIAMSDLCQANGLMLEVTKKVPKFINEINHDEIYIPLGLKLKSVNTNLNLIKNLEKFKYLVTNSIYNITNCNNKLKSILQLNYKDINSMVELEKNLYDKKDDISTIEIKVEKDQLVDLQNLMKLVNILNNIEIDYIISGVPFCIPEFRNKVISTHSKMGNASSYANLYDYSKYNKVSKKCIKCNLLNICGGYDSYIIESLWGIEINNKILSLSTVSLSEIKNIDTIVLYSGGLDSRVTLCKYAKANRHENIMMVHFADNSTMLKSRLYNDIDKILDENPNILYFGMIDLCDTLYFDIINNQSVWNISNRIDSNLTCLMCKALFIYYACVLSRYLDSKNIVMGNNQVKGTNKANPPIPQSKTMQTLYKQIPDYFNLNIKYPIYQATKRAEVVKIANSYNLDLSSSWCSSKCPYGLPRTLKYGIEKPVLFLTKFIEDLLNKDVLKEKFKEEFCNDTYIERFYERK